MKRNLILGVPFDNGVLTLQLKFALAKGGRAPEVDTKDGVSNSQSRVIVDGATKQGDTLGINLRKGRGIGIHMIPPEPSDCSGQPCRSPPLYRISYTSPRQCSRTTIGDRLEL